MKSKVLFGLYDGKIAVLDADTSEEAIKETLKEGCTDVIIAEYNAQMSDCWLNQKPVKIEDFVGVDKHVTK
jgi:hypothetical protein